MKECPSLPFEVCKSEDLQTIKTSASSDTCFTRRKCFALPFELIDMIIKHDHIDTLANFLKDNDDFLDGLKTMIYETDLISQIRHISRRKSTLFEDIKSGKIIEGMLPLNFELNDFIYKMKKKSVPNSDKEFGTQENTNKIFRLILQKRWPCYCVFKFLNKSLNEYLCLSSGKYIYYLTKEDHQARMKYLLMMITMITLCCCMIKKNTPDFFDVSKDIENKSSLNEKCCVS